MRKTLYGSLLLCVVGAAAFLILKPEPDPTSATNSLQRSERLKTPRSQGPKSNVDSVTKQKAPRKVVPSTTPKKDSSAKNGTAIDITELADQVGDETAAVIANGGPFEAVHVRTIALSIKTMETRLIKLRERGADRSEVASLSKSYMEMQNHYYTALNDLEPYEPNSESSEKLTELKRVVEADDGRMNEAERQDLKRDILLTESN